MKNKVSFKKLILKWNNIFINNNEKGNILEFFQKKKRKKKKIIKIKSPYTIEKRKTKKSILAKRIK